MNILQQQYKYIRKQQHLLTTKVTSNSFDIVNHLITTLHKILTRRIKTIKKQSINKLNKYNKIQPQMLLFLHHCATIIQSRFKGYQQRKYYQLFKPLLRRFKQLLIAVVSGWRIRRILKTKIINKKCMKIKECIGKQNYRQARILKRQLIDDLNQIVGKGKWLEFVEKKNGYGNRKQNVTKITKILLKTKEKNNGKNQIIQQKSSKVNKNQTKRQEQSERQKNQIQNNRLNINVIQQKPIKATGFYKIPDQQLNQNPQPIQSNTIKNKKKFLKTTNLKQSSKTQPKEDSKKEQKVQNTKNNDQKPVKNDKINQSLSILSIHLPTQQLQIKQNQIFPIPNKTIRLQMKKNMKNQRQNINRNNQIQPNIPQATKIKKIPQKKGIKVTLSLSNSKVEQNTVNNKQIQLEVKQQQKQPKQQKNNIKNNIKKQYQNQNQHKDQLSQIIQIYNYTYSSKKNQIASRLSQMRSHKKFTSAIK